MEIMDLKKICISNLILIILNNKNNDLLRKCAEIELKKRVKNVGWEYNDLLHFDDKVIIERGYDIDNYLISENVNMQQVMEVYFKYNWKVDYNSNYLLFSEKHLCNEADFMEPFFSKICSKEIENLDKRIISNEQNKQLLINVKKELEKRQDIVKQQKILKEGPINLLCQNEAMCHLIGDIWNCHEFLYNYTDEEKYKLLSSKLGLLKISLFDTLNNTLFNCDMMQYLCGLGFVIRDSRKLNTQKRQLLHQVNSEFEIDYSNNNIQKRLEKTI